MSMAAYDRQGVLCVGVVGSCRMQTVVVFRVAPGHTQEETVFAVSEYVESSCLYGKESMKHRLAGCCFQRQPTANDVS